tara:strand:- start:8250 stop:9374 length:1125 start_codon:yes stop_codon:yes gene_type:complete
LVEKLDQTNRILSQLKISKFTQSFPWIGGDLQTLRDSFSFDSPKLNNSEVIHVRIPGTPNGDFKAGSLLSLLSYPKANRPKRGLVVLLHGLGGSSERLGLKRMAKTLLKADFAVLRVNLRGAPPGRNLVGGTYSAECSSDVIPVLIEARKLCLSFENDKINNSKKFPLFGVGISLGGTILLNSCFSEIKNNKFNHALLDGLVCTSSPLDLDACSKSIDRKRNLIYQKWLLNRLIKQTIADPFNDFEFSKHIFLRKSTGKVEFPNSIRDFDDLITAPRWCYKSVDEYYELASPLKKLLRGFDDRFPKTLILQSEDDPWVPAESAKDLFSRLTLSELSKINIVITKKGGHNGFHSKTGCWGDLLVKNWLCDLACRI